MKKAKILLTTIGIFAIVGGALAFEAKRNAKIFCSTTTGIAGQCNIPLEGWTFTTESQSEKEHCTTNLLLSCLIIRNLTTLP